MSFAGMTGMYYYTWFIGSCIPSSAILGFIHHSVFKERGNGSREEPSYSEMSGQGSSVLSASLASKIVSGRSCRERTSIKMSSNKQMVGQMKMWMDAWIE